MALSARQEKIKTGKGLFVVQACPGSGKTFSVAARIAHLLNDTNNDFHFKGIAALSFTNVACDEINDKLQNDFGISVPLKFPHFVGTIDSFVNKYIFLPYGHLFMKCKNRPDLVGQPNGFWHYPIRQGDKGEKAFYQLFDHFSFDSLGNVIEIKSTRETFLKGNYKNVKHHIQSAKITLFKEGYANQTDANYIALNILNNKCIAENIANRFSNFIVDEAQDTTDVQMGILQKLIDNDAKEMILIGDPDQAIFEWNDAKPELFEAKYNEWEQSKDFLLLENRRSSKLICNCTRNLLSKQEYDIIGTDKDYPGVPNVIGHQSNKESIEIILTTFKNACKEIPCLDENGENNLAVLYRSNSMSDWLGIPNLEKEQFPWKNGHYYARDLAKGKYLLDRGELKKGFRSFERGYHKLMNNLNYFSNENIRKEINKVGFKEYRNTIFEFAKHFKSTQNISLANWIAEANKKLKLAAIEKRLEIVNGKANISFDELFLSSSETKNSNYFSGTIHSAKGKTFEAVLVILDKGFTQRREYKKILLEDYAQLKKPKEKEEMRTIYVAITRPRKILMIAVPSNDVGVWEKKLDLKVNASGTHPNKERTYKSGVDKTAIRKQK